MSKWNDALSSGARPVDPRPKKGDSGFFDVKDTSYKPPDGSPRETLLDMFQNMFGTSEGSEYLTSLEQSVADGKRKQRNMIIGGIIILCAFFC